METISQKFKVALVLGGARSGKSRYALSLAEGFPRPRLFVATCEPGDQEMLSRIADHQRERGPDWETREACLDLPDLLANPPGGYGVLLVDCLTMWLSNLMHKEDAKPAETEVESARLAQALAGAPIPTILVSNEVGSGIVPDNPLAREFRDQAGWLHQEVAKVADLVVLVVAGLPVVIKG